MPTQPNNAPTDSKHIPFFGIRGRNGSDPVFMIPDTQCVEALNVDFYQSSLGRKRGGAAAIGITGGTAFGSGVRFLFRHVPSADQTAAELWGTDGTGLTKRLTGGTAFADVTFDDAITDTYGEVNAVSFNGKLFLAYNSAVNRLHCWDPADSKVRRVGLARPAAPTVADQGSGSYAAVSRYYKVAYTVQSGGITLRRSNLSPISLVFTPSGSGASARVTKPAAISEGETHWEVYGSPDDGIYSLVGTTAVATTTFDDNTNPTTYSGATAQDFGSNTPPPSAKFLVADDARIIMGGAWETTAGTGMTPKASRIWWTDILGATDVGDDERVLNTIALKGYADVEEALSAMSPPLQGSFYAFSYDGQWKFVSTGVVEAPYLRFKIAGGAGCIQHKTLVMGDDEAGNPAIYWLSSRGPMRIGTGGQQFLGEDIIDIWSTVNLEATTTVGHAVYIADKHQVWFYVATAGSNTPNMKLVFDTRLGRMSESSGGVRHGWSKHTGESAKAYASTMFSSTIGAAMTRALKPHLSYTGSTAIWKADTTDLDDAGTAFQAYIESKPMAPWGLGRLGGLTEEICLVAKASAGVTITLTVNHNEGALSRTSTALLTAISDGGAEERVFPQFEGSAIAQASSVRLRVGDSAAVANAWNIDAVIAPIASEGER